VTWSPDGSVLAVAKDSGTQLWNVTTGQQIGQTLATGNSNMSADTLSWNLDGKTLAVGLSNGRVQLWNLAGLAAAALPAYLCGQAHAGRSITRSTWAQEAAGVPYQNVCQ
jgi:hypothetical protein